MTAGGGVGGAVAVVVVVVGAISVVIVVVIMVVMIVPVVGRPDRRFRRRRCDLGRDQRARAGRGVGGDAALRVGDLHRRRVERRRAPRVVVAGVGVDRDRRALHG